MREVSLYLKTAGEYKTIVITSEDKPEISSRQKERWQKLVNLIADFLHVSSVAIMQFSTDSLDVTLCSETPGNPYRVGQKIPLGSGVYCEMTAALGKVFSSTNALESDVGDDFSPIADNLISYFGIPIHWPDKECFGVLCVCDKKKHSLIENQRQLILVLHSTIESDLREIASRHKKENQNSAKRRELRQSATCDQLTGLYNHSAFVQNADAMIREAELENKRCAVGIVNIRNFSGVNEIHGIETADRLLQRLADRLEELRRDGLLDLVGRLHGGNFIVLTPAVLSRKDAEGYCERLLEFLSHPFFLGKESIALQYSLGVAISNSGMLDTLKLIDRANLVQSRLRGKENEQQLFVYDGELAVTIERKVAIEKKLPKAMAEQKITLVYQPQIDCATGHIIGVEALARWRDDELGVISPVEFIEVAERSNFVSALGHYIVLQAMREFADFAKDSKLGISINISPRQLFDQGFYRSINAAVDRAGIDPHRVTLEITENVFLDGLDIVLPHFEALHKKGFNISLDDFGTGYSSLSYLSRIPFTEVKIDKSFVDDLLTNIHNQVLVKSVIALGEAGNLRIVAEGVETQEQERWLVRNHCDAMQGYYFDKPMPMNELIARYRTDQMQKYQKDSELLDMADSLDFGSCWYDDYSIRLLSQGIMEFYTEDTLKRCSISMRQQAKLLVLKVEIIK